MVSFRRILYNIAFITIVSAIASSAHKVVVTGAAADEVSHAEARLAKLSQASQSSQGLTNGFGFFVTRHKACLITRPLISDKSNDLIHGQQERGCYQGFRHLG